MPASSKQRQYGRRKEHRFVIRVGGKDESGLRGAAEQVGEVGCGTRREEDCEEEDDQGRQSDREPSSSSSSARGVIGGFWA